MKIAEFKAFCPYEIGDKITFKAFGGIQTIKDIRTIHYLASGKTDFEIQVEAHPKSWIPLYCVLKRIE